MMRSGVRQVAVMGTMHEVGYWEGPVTEDTPCRPMSMYGIAKNALREAFLLRAKELDVTAQWLRAFYIRGDDAHSQSIFGKLYRAAKEGKKTFPFTSGQNKYDFIKVDELASQLCACLCQDKVTGVINCCTGKPVSLGEEVESFIEEKGLDISLEYGAFPDRPYDSPAIWGDSSKINNVLGEVQK